MNIINSLDEISSYSEEQKYQVYLSESLTTSYPIQDCHEPLVDLVELASTHNLPIVFAPVAPDVNPLMKLRLSVANNIMAVVTELQQMSNNTLTLKITDTFRPLSLQRKYFEEIKKDIQEKEHLSGKQLWEKVTQFIADPDLCPPHSTGGAIDCTLFSLQENREIDMGTPLDSIDDRSNTWSLHVSEEQKKNRLLLFNIMIKHQFVNLTSEWWHYSHGDQYWAIVKGLPFAKYGSLETS